jgi:hypothetical protein
MSTVEAKRAAIAARYKAKERQPFSMTAVRIAELNRLLRERYGHVLPDDDAGRDDALVVCCHLARCREPDRRMRRWLELWAPWMPPDEQATLITNVSANPLRWRADPLGKRMGLTAAERSRLRITTIGSTDMGKADRKARRRQQRRDRDRRYREQQRRAKGAKPRKDYVDNALTRQKPWLVMGISRRSWYRRQRGTSANGTSQSATI